MKEEIVELIGLDKRKFEVYKIDEKLEKERRVKIIYVKLRNKKYRCPKCNKFTSSVHDVVKPVKIKYLDIAGHSSLIYLSKRRFICHKCNIKFTESTNLHEKSYFIK